MSNQTTSCPPVTLDSVFSAVTHWRNNKDSYDSVGIPDDIWASIFQLEDQGCSSKDLRRMLALNTSQYNKKREIRAAKMEEMSHSTPPGAAPLFSEVLLQGEPVPTLSAAAEQTKQATKQIRSTAQSPEKFLDMSTVIVEVVRPDGHRLMIHTTNQALDVVMHSFCSQEVTP